MTAKLQVRLGGRPGHMVGHGYTAVAYETVIEGGLGDASWVHRLPAGSAVPEALQSGARAEIWCNGLRVWYGSIESYDLGTGQVSAIGPMEEGERIPALDTLGAATRQVNPAIVNAILTYRWAIDETNMAGSVVGDLTEPLMVADLVKQRGETQGLYTRISARGRLATHAPATEPKWRIRARGLQMEFAGASRVTGISARYRPTASTRGTTTRWASWHDPARRAANVKTVDLTKYGVLTTAQANNIVDNLLQRVGDQPTWVNALDVHQSQITNMADTPATFINVQAGDMVRIESLTAAQQKQVGAAYLDAPLAKVVVTSGSQLIHLEPVGTVPQTVEDALVAVMKK